MQSDHDNQSHNEVHSSLEHSDSEAEKEVLTRYKVISFKGHIPELYKNFVMATWLNSLKHHNPLFKDSDRDGYYGAYPRFIEALIARSVTKIAVLDGDEDVAFGWSCVEGNKLHYIFVREDSRRMGFAKSLYPQNIKVYTHMTDVGRSLWKQKFPTNKFNPFL